MAFGIPTSQELTVAGIALEDHAAIQAQAVIDYLMDRLAGITITITVPPKKTP